MDLWVVITLAASAVQTLRFMLQKRLKSVGLSTGGATYARFVFAAPLAMAALAALMLARGDGLPALPPAFWIWAMAGGLAQIVATFATVALFSARSFAVGIAFTKTEVLLVAALSALLLSEPVSRDGLLAIAIGTVGVLFLSRPAGGWLAKGADHRALMLVVVVLGMVIAHRTRFGTSVYALGGGEQTARLMGVRQGRTTVLVYAFSGLMAGLSGIVFSVYTGSGYSLAAVGTELTAIAAVVIGGTLLSGGAGYVFGTLVGVLTMGLIQTYIVFDGSLSSWWTKIVIGLLLLAFILLQKGLLRLSRCRLAGGAA
ncbi:ABC transporter permease subunit [Paracoccus nototheniae]|uniref:ABC transporter permease subunit n=1 Tax=Paracoccus nototheniae TaxID=2489002 RepID=UPI00103C3384|nr:sugar ABC transporter permease YjfF [Paracoccus nototheniae]